LVAGFDWTKSADILAAMTTAETVLAGNGRVLLRPSGTEPLLRVMVEGRDEAVVVQQAEYIASVVKRVIAQHGSVVSTG